MDTFPYSYSIVQKRIPYSRKKSPISSIEALDRAVNLLEHLSENSQGLSLSGLARKTGLAPSTVHRYLAALQQHRFVWQSGDKIYSLTSRLYLLGLSASEAFDLETQSQDSLRRLAAITHETSCLMVSEGRHSVCISQVDSRHQLKIAARIGSRQDLRVGATSRTLLAYMPTEVQRDILNQPPLEQYTDNTVTDPSTIEGILNAIRRQGYYVSTSEVDAGVVAVAAPVRDRTGTVIAALAVAAPESRLTEQEALAAVVKLIREEADDLSLRLGYFSTPKHAERTPA